ncbi:hypothetical protein HMPREF9946_00661 [Acetobacteraceae bacterium AT-5844]|nr:hypothetical protein HMPREF9946_00661 [Acetobacteraceae bacterium AT-5844]
MRDPHPVLHAQRRLHGGENEGFHAGKREGSIDMRQTLENWAGTVTLCDATPQGPQARLTPLYVSGFEGRGGTERPPAHYPE